MAFEPGKLTEKAKPNSTNGTISMLPDDNLSDPFIRCILVVDFISIYKSYQLTSKYFIFF